MTLVILVFLALTGHAVIGYPLLMAGLARLRPRPSLPHPASPPADDPAPGLSIVLCVRNPAGQIRPRLENLLACQWHGPLEIIVYCDGCTDGTPGLLRQGLPDHVRVIESPTPKGKAAGLNAAIPLCRHPLVVLCDVRQTFAPDTLLQLAAPFADPRVAAVSGLLDIAASGSGGGRGVDLYWRLETKLREWESRYDSVIGCTGAVCAIRRDLYTPLPEDTLLDDVVIPMRLAVAGHRVVFEPAARAFDPQTLNPGLETRRKLRTLVGNFQMLERHPYWLLPWQNRLWWQLISHKYLRLAVPWLLIAVAALSLLAPRSPFIFALIAAQAVLYACALAGRLFPRSRSRLLTVPAGFVLLQTTCLAAFFAYLRCRRNYRVLWQPAPPTPTRP
jgi:cellulose synthase/poly-beta-1,6-N-acetylglucosamine synthase-like glycosyltransferase